MPKIPPISTQTPRFIAQQQSKSSTSYSNQGRHPITPPPIINVNSGYSLGVKEVINSAEIKNEQIES